MPPTSLEILYEDNHLLAINKPAGLPTMGAAAGVASAYRLASQYIKHTYHKPGAVYLGVVSRLDSVTTGVVLFARTSKAARRLTEQFRRCSARKEYWAIISGGLSPPEGELMDWLAKDESLRQMVVVDPSCPSAKEARLRYQTVRSVGGGKLLRIELVTGRKHQIRVQLAGRGCSIWGETKYAAGASFSPGIALHARTLTVEHPVRREPLELTAPWPESWLDVGIDR